MSDLPPVPFETAFRLSSGTTAGRDLPVVSFETASRLWSGTTADNRDVRRCEDEHHGRHVWITVRVEYRDRAGIVTFCKSCGVRMCAAIVVEADPGSECQLPMGHGPNRLHRDASNRWREVEKVRSLT